ncbi:MAG: hypothetical protein WA777_20905 [Rhodanobacter sp.]
MARHVLLTLVVGALALHVGLTHASDHIESATKLTFGSPSTLFVGDWKGAHIYALTVPVAKSAATLPFNVKDVQGPIANALHVQTTALRFEDLAVQPGTGLAFVALTVKEGASASRPALVTINADGKVMVEDLQKIPHSSVAITDEPAADEKFWRNLPAQSLTVTDMRFYNNKLYVAGLSNRSFASTLRIYDYPFNGKSTASTIEMYHPVHNEIETRAPIREMSIMSVGGQPTLIAAYTCTPLVAIPLSDLKDGAHITAKTIGELGWGSAPRGMVTFKFHDVDYALLVNSSRAADLLSLPAISDAAAQPGIKTPINWPADPYKGVKAIMTPMSAAMRIDNFNDDLLLALRRDDATGDMQLVTIPKGVYLRLSDFVNEYDFTDYVYPPDDPFHAFHKVARKLEGYPELVR